MQLRNSNGRGRLCDMLTDRIQLKWQKSTGSSCSGVNIWWGFFYDIKLNIFGFGIAGQTKLDISICELGLWGIVMGVFWPFSATLWTKQWIDYWENNRGINR